MKGKERYTDRSTDLRNAVGKRDTYTEAQILEMQGEREIHTQKHRS